MSTFGAVPTTVIYRMSELTKNEIIVLCYLYSCQNRRTKQCNPRQSEIASATGIHKSHVCRAMDGLHEKGWVCQQAGRQFTLTIPITVGRPSLPFTEKKVTKSATEKLPNPQLFVNEKVTESATKVTKSATKSCEIGNSLIKEKNTVLTQKEHIEAPIKKKKAKSSKPKDPRTNHPAIQKMRAIIGRYPDKVLWDSVIDALDDPDEVRLKACYVEWRKKGFSPMNFGWAFDWYINGVNTNGTNRNNNGVKQTPGQIIANRPYR